MNLSNREIEMISDISKARRHRRIGAWLGLATALIVFVGTQYFDFGRESLGPIVGIFLGLAVAELSSAYFGIRSEDKLVDLLQRYINSDPEAIEQLSTKSTSSGFAA